MPVRHIKDSESSSLPTPKARDAIAEGYEAGFRRASPQLGTIVKAVVIGDDRVTLMPTPTVSDTYTANLSSTQQKEGSLHSVTLAQIVNRPDLLPTPVVNDMGANKTVEAWDEWTAATKAKHKNGNGHGASLVDNLLGTPRTSSANGSTEKQRNDGASKGRLEDQVLLTNWGKFEPAIRRWEILLGRPAPAPTKPDGKEGAHRLSSAFTEWMMGLPKGWITDTGLTRAEELKACGNGVVPQQAELALRMLLQSLKDDGIEPVSYR